MEQLTLVESDLPALPASIDLRLCSVQELIANITERAALVVADPPWHYSQAPGHSANPENHYASMSDDEIVEVLDSAFDIVANGRLALWCTWPKMGQFFDACERGRFRWKYVSGGSWMKTGGRPGTGYHWLGQTEPVLLFKTGKNLCTRWGSLTNGHAGPRGKHSEKPEEWMDGWVERWTEPGELVVDLFAGLGPLARSCARLGRRYMGAEIDPDRHKMALGMFACGDTREKK